LPILSANNRARQTTRRLHADFDRQQHYNRDPRFADILMALLKREDGLLIGDNEPYGVSDASDYTIPVHGERRGLLHVEFEIRQDLIADASGQRAWGALLARLMPQAYQPQAYQELVAGGVPKPA
jgi:predicted N-formylglutamate amidohydrolase